MPNHHSVTSLDWAVFAAVVLGALVIDYLVSGRKNVTSFDREIGFREAVLRSLFFIGVALLFGLFVWHRLGTEHAVSYTVAYLVEKSLSIDNLFVFLVIFNHFGVRAAQQQRVLFWGVAGAAVVRGLFIAAGAALLHRFNWMMFVFGAFLVVTGVRLGLRKGETEDPTQGFTLRMAQRYLRTVPDYDGHHFFTVRDGVRHATPLVLVLVSVELADVMFAVDSVPAVLAISQNVFVVYTSNIFAILGLRALYFALAGMMGRFRFLAVGLAVILTFVGVKMLLANWVHIPSWISLCVIAAVLLVSVLASLVRTDDSQAPS
ncbi:MAG: TerC/Alx family metal homeostasis membrane protein [Polyangiaceae bacterium]|nr:TerC/Alx family metal homeostasis membrane protein [Polyangiaceae bacterium]